MKSHLLFSLVVSFACLLRGSTIQAQTSTAPSADQLATITTDTGDFAPGRVSLAHYTTLQLCMAGATNAGHLAQRGVDAQITAQELALTPLRDTLATRAVTVASECLARFTVQGTATHDLPDLVTLALMAGRDTLARAAVTRWLSLIPTVVARDSALLQAMALYLTAHPARPADAESLTSRVAQTGVAGDRMRLTVAETMLHFWNDVFDHPHTQRWAEEVLRRVNAMPGPPGAGYLKYSALQAYQALLRAVYVDAPDSLPAITARAVANVHRFQNDSIAPLSFDPATATVENISQMLAPAPETWRHAGEVYPTLHAEYWFPARPAARDTSMTLFISTQASWDPRVFDGPGCFTGEVALMYDGADQCNPLYEKIRRLGAQYGSRLTLVLIAGTQGNAVRSLPLSPQKEAERLKWYVLDYLKLPVTLAVVERPVFQIPQPDGRHFAKSVCANYFPDASFMNDSSVTACRFLALPMILLGHRGELIYAGAADPLFDAILEKEIPSISAPTGTTVRSHDE